MCNFNKQSEETQARIHLFMTKVADSVGGSNFLLALIEAMKTKQPHPLMFKACQIASNNTIIKWNKIIFKDKIDLLETILATHRSSEDPDFNILNEPNTEKKKNIINTVRALTPVEFVVTPQNENDGTGFSFKVFDTISDKEVKLNPIFIAMFFCSVEFTKKALKHKID